MFAFPQEVKEGSPPEGTSDVSPIILEGIKIDEFRALLRYLYPKYVHLTIFLETALITLRQKTRNDRATFA